MEDPLATQQISGSKSKSKPSGKGKSSEGSRASGTTGHPDEVYGLVSVLYHALQGAQTYAEYVSDAQRSRDEELVEFFQECQMEEVDRAERARGLLAARLDGMSADESNGEDEDEDEES